MTTFAITLPLARVSPVHVPTRDLVLGGSDSLALEVTVVERDSPDAAPIELTGGIGGPALSMLIWPDRRGVGPWDYGWGWYGPCAYGLGTYGAGSVLWSGVGTISTTSAGTFDFWFPTATMASWPRRMSYNLQLDWNGGGDTELLSAGILHLAPSLARSITPLIMLTDPTPAVLTDPNAEAIFIDGAPIP